MVSSTLAEENVVTYTIDDLRSSVSAEEFYNLLYVILNFQLHLFLEESDIYIRWYPLSDDASYIELVESNTHRILEWKYIEGSLNSLNSNR